MSANRPGGAFLISWTDNDEQDHWTAYRYYDATDRPDALADAQQEYRDVLSRDTTQTVTLSESLISTDY